MTYSIKNINTLCREESTSDNFGIFISRMMLHNKTRDTVAMNRMVANMFIQ